MKKATIWYIVGVLALTFGLIAWGGKSSSDKAASTLPDPSGLPGLLTTVAPWPSNIGELRARLSALGFPILKEEGTALHIHQHLDIFIDGKKIAVPSDIGVNDAAGFISSLHVHDDTGIIHVESPIVQTFTLGQFFDVWGVKFASTTIGAYTADASKSLRVYVNGKLYDGDPRQLALAAHQEIAIYFGSAVPKDVPASYDFPVDY